ncbi:MAG: hypothetical protein H8E42_06880 [Nitrospinae bacterium]|nr:hypothetical protein [Nitrospinota bacterium]MBL7018900.1 hypothetical protein [Nitrospinaceae bacterium]
MEILVWLEANDLKVRFEKPLDSSLTLRMTCKNRCIVILMSLGEEGSRLFSVKNNLRKFFFIARGASMSSWPLHFSYVLLAANRHW